MQFAAMRESGFGTKAQCTHVRDSSEVLGRRFLRQDDSILFAQPLQAPLGSPGLRAPALVRSRSKGVCPDCQSAPLDAWAWAFDLACQISTAIWPLAAQIATMGRTSIMIAFLPCDPA